MLSITPPRLKLLPHTNLSPHYHHGIAISVLRGLAAVQVVAAHVRAQFYPGLKTLPDPTLAYQALSFFTGFAHQAVVVFFVLSGWLVGGSLLNKLHLPDAMLGYALDRATRLWIVLLPAFLLTLGIGVLDGAVDPRRVDFSSDNPYSLTTLGGNLAGVQDMAVPRYGGNFALWSLAYETWYYVLFPLLVLAWRARRYLARLAAAAAALLICWQLDSDIVLYFSLWLLGAACSRVRIEASPAWIALFAGVLAAVSVWFRLTGSNDILVAASFAQDLLFSVCFLALLCCLQTPANMRNGAVRWTAAAGERLAAFSFTLYVIHVPLLLAIRRRVGRFDPDSAADFAGYAAVLAALIGLAWLFHLPFEAQTVRVRRWVRGLLRPRVPVQNIA